MTLFKVVDFYIQAARKWFPVSPENLLWAVAILVVIKLSLHAALALAAWRFKSDKIEGYVFKISRAHRKLVFAPPKTLTQGIKSDLTQPFFMVSLLLTSIFLIFSESDRTQVILGVLKPLATAFLCFLCIRLLPLEKIKSESLQKALKYLKGI
jgi:hypothetical protein